LGSYENSSAGYSLGGASGYLGSEAEGKNLSQMMDSYYQKSYPSVAAFWVQGSIDKRFKAGDQSLWQMNWGDNNWQQSRRWFFNFIRRQVNMICGRQRQNRKSTITIPNHQDDPLSDDYNACLKWCEDRDGFQEYFSQAFEGAVDTGMSLLHLYPDYTLDPVNGDLFTDQVSYNNFLIDPYFRKQDLTDCGFVWRRRWVSQVQAKALLPGYAKEIDKMRPTGLKDGRFPLQAELLNMATNNLFAYDEFHYRTTREATVILDPKSGEAVLWEELQDDSEDELEQVLAQQPWLIAKKTQVPTVRLGIKLGGRVIYDGPNLLQIDDYPFVPLLAYHEPDIQSYAWRVQGVIRNLRDCQYLVNMRKVIEMDILQSQINSGWIYPVDAVVDPKAFRQSGQGFIIPLKAGHLPNEIQRIDAPGLPQSVIELSRGLVDDLSRISGVNEELLGAAQDDKSGILSMLRQGAGLTTLQTLFDKADYSQRLYGKIRLKAIRKNFSKGKIASILGREPNPKFFTTHSLKYAVTVEEGNYSANQRQMELQQLLHFKEIGMTVADKSIWRAAFLTNKAQAEQDAAEQSQQQAQQQQQQAEQQAKSEESKIQAAYAKARVDMAKEQEIMASTQEKLANIDNIESDAERRKMETDLGLVKMMLELETMDFNQMREAFTMAQTIKQANQAQDLQTLK